MIRLMGRLIDVMGEPKDIWVFDPHEVPAAAGLDLRLVHVPVWPADETSDVTAFNTLGMSERTIPGADFAAELHFGIRGALDEPGCWEVARFLANLAQFPFHRGVRLDWWDLIREPGAIPYYPNCRHLLLYPRFAEDGLDLLDDPDGPVKLFYVIPITARERELILADGQQAFLDHVREWDIDLLAHRPDPHSESAGEAP
jgi:hypothetical protein